MPDTEPQIVAATVWEANSIRARSSCVRTMLLILAMGLHFASKAVEGKRPKPVEVVVEGAICIMPLLGGCMGREVWKRRACSSFAVGCLTNLQVPLL